MRLNLSPRSPKPRATAKHVVVQQGQKQGQRRAVLQAVTLDRYRSAVFN